MWEENQNITQNVENAVWVNEQMSPIRMLANSMNERKAQIRNSVNNTSTQENQSQLESMFEKSLTSDNQELCQSYDRECRKWEFAFYLKEKGKERWYNTEWIANDDLLDSYIWNTKNPQLTYNIMKDYILHPEETDITPYLIRLWWVEPTQEEEAKWFFEKLWDNVKWSFDKSWQWIRTIWNNSNMYDWKWTIWAIQDYAYNTYGSNLTDEDWRNVDRDIRINPSLLDKYTSSKEWLKDTIMWWTVNLMNTNPFWLLTNIWFSTLWATPYVEDAIWLIWAWSEKVWFYANKLPWLKQYRDSLADEESQRERDQFIWQEIIWLLLRFMFRKKQNSAKDFVKDIENNQWDIIKAFEELKQRKELEKQNKQALEREKNAAAEQERQVKSQRVLADFAWTLLEPKDRSLKPDLSNWIINLPDRVLNWWTKTFEWLVNEVRDTQWWIIDIQNSILKQIKNKKTGPSNDTYTTKNWATINPVMDAIDLLRKLYAWQPDNLAKLDKYETKYRNWEITELDKKNLAREISINSNSFDSNFHLKNNTSQKSVESVRDWLQDSIKSTHPFIDKFMTVTDTIYSNLAKVKKFANEKADKISSERDKQKIPSTKRKIMGSVWNVVDTVLSKWKNIYNNAISDAREPYKPTTLEKDLPTILKAFYEEKKNIPWEWFNVSAFIELLDEWNYNPEKYKYSTDTKSFLEDIIESSDIENTKTDSLMDKLPKLQDLLYAIWANEADVSAIEKAFNVEERPVIWWLNKEGKIYDLQGNDITDSKIWKSKSTSPKWKWK